MNVDFNQQTHTLPGHDLAWLADMRQAGQVYFEQTGLPKPKDELWRYTRVKAIAERDWQFCSDTTVDTEKLAKHIPDLGSQKLVFVDGEFSAELSNLELGSDKVIVSDLASVLATEPELIKDFLGQNLEVNHGFSALNIALLKQGAVISIADDTVLEQPLHIVCLQTQSELAHQWRHLIYLGENSQARVIEHYIGLEDKCYFNNIVTEISLAQRAQLQYEKIQQDSQAAYHIASTHFRLQKRAQLWGYGFNLGSALGRSDVQIALAAEHAQAHWRGLFIARGEQHLDQPITLEHIEPHTHSDVLVKGIATDKAHAVFNGKIFVAPQAQKVNAQLRSKNLLLTSTAAIDTKPELEIYADDVKCAHGATVGQLDTDALFYLRARGIPEVMAKQLLLNAFIRDIFADIHDEKMQAYLELQLQQQ